MKTTVLIQVVLVAAVAVSAGVSSAQTVPLVVAVDTSRSLTATDLLLVRETAEAQLRRLPAGSNVGLVAFNDEAHWLAGPGASPAEAITALDRLVPAGNYTVLHDALFVIARELDQGGVIFLISDGRDENSATTVEDVARLCTDTNVRIVAASLGRRVDERALRRITLLAEGTYSGRLPGAEAETVASAIAEARTAVAAETAPRPAAQQPPSAPPQTVTQVPSQAEATGEESFGLPFWIIPVGVGVVLLIVIVIWLMLRQQRRDEAAYDDIGYPFDSEPKEETGEQAPPPPPELEDVAQAANDQPVAEMAVPEESILDPKVFDKEPLPEGLERTMVLDELPVLIVRQTGRPPRSYTLPRDQIFAVGRAPKVNTLQVQEPTVSAQHFKVVPKEGEFYVVDLDTTNGTSVNHQKVKVRKLSPGDVINAGTVDFEFKLSVRRMT